MTTTEKTIESFPALKYFAKNAYPFFLACPSFVYRAGYVENVRRLAPFVDEIQLLFFESRPPENLPTSRLVDELADLAEAHKITYNVHLPSDIYPGHPVAEERRHAAETIQRVMECCAPLQPSSFTLHLNPDPDDKMGTSMARWHENQIKTLKRVLDSGIDGQKISVETLDYPLDLVAPVIESLDLSVCMDIGHLMVYGFDVDGFYEKWKDRITILHLHGVAGKRDHLPLDQSSSERIKQVMKILSRFFGPVTLEVYSYESLNASLKCLSDEWGKRL